MEIILASASTAMQLKPETRVRCFISHFNGVADDEGSFDVVARVSWKKILNHMPRLRELNMKPHNLSSFSFPFVLGSSNGFL